MALALVAAMTRQQGFTNGSNNFGHGSGPMATTMAQRQLTAQRDSNGLMVTLAAMDGWL
jgi:hypothetical protein